jgi:hypothetical protein
MSLKKLAASEYERREKLIKKSIAKIDIELESKRGELSLIEANRNKILTEIDSLIDFKKGELQNVSNKIEDKKKELTDKFQPLMDTMEHYYKNANQVIQNYEAIKSILESNAHHIEGLGLITGLPLSERKNCLKDLKFNKKVELAPFVVASGHDNVDKSINKMANMKGSEGAVIKDMSAPYTFGETRDTWIKYRRLVSIDARIIEKFPKENGTFNYLVGIDLNEKELKTITPSHVKSVNGKNELVLGHTFNTKEDVSGNKVIKVSVQEIWRHEDKEGLHYSIHKPKFLEELNQDTTSNLNDLENIVTSVGAVVKEFANIGLEEGSKSIKNWPPWVQSGLKAALERNISLPYVIQHHYRGTSVTTADNAPEKYKYRLKSVHSDFRNFIPKNIDTIKEGTVIKYEDAKNMEGICYGITINTPPSVDKTDEFDMGAKNILCEFKLPIPKGWLYVQGVADINEPGSSQNEGRSYAPAVFIIAGKGNVIPTEVTDHIIKLEFKSEDGNVNQTPFEEADKKGILIENKFSSKLKELDGEFEFTINHLGDKHLIFLSKVNSRGKKQMATKEMLNKIFTMTTDNATRGEISEAVGASKSTIYTYQKQLGLI